jgi:hypothetical protein
MGEVMFEMVFNFLTILCHNWKIRLLGLSSDEAQNITGHVFDVVTRLQDSMQDDCSLFCIWCEAHQLDLVMEQIMNEVIKEHFFSVMIGFITHLTRQQKLIVDMDTTCLCIVNRWLYTYKVTKWFKIHCPELLTHIELKQPASAPPQLWWAYLLVTDDFTNRTIVTFRKLQGLTTLVVQQQVELDAFIDSFIDDTGMTSPFTTKSIQDLDQMTHVFNGRYAVFLSNVQELLVGLASWVEGITNEANEVK